MVVSGLRLVNFRSYCDATVRFGPGLNVVVGANATGKTNLLEAAWFALRGSSPRTRRDEKLITWGERFSRVELQLDTPDAGAQQVDVGFAPGQGKRLRWDGLEVASLDDLRGRSQVFIFVPESLLLVKGSPARRRAHLDAFAAALDPQYAAAARDLQGVLRQRNAQLAAVKNGAAAGGARSVGRAVRPGRGGARAPPPRPGRRARGGVLRDGGRAGAGGRALQPAARGATRRRRVRRGRAARRAARRGGPARSAAACRCTGPIATTSSSSRSGGATDGAVRRLAAAIATPAIPTVTGGSGLRPGRRCRSGGRDLRLFGSQGEQRAAVLALLLAEQRLAAARTGQHGPLFLDDVMSELDDARRRLLVRMLATAGQAIITTTNRHYFSDDELARATVIELPLEVRSRPVRRRRRSTTKRRRRRRSWTRCERGREEEGRKTSGDQAKRPRSNGAGGRRDELPRRLGDILTPALDRLAGGDEARAYAAWARAVGEPVSGGTRPKAFRRGQLTIECASSVWANELTYLGPQILRRMDEVAPGHPVERFRFIVGRLSRRRSRTRRSRRPAPRSPERARRAP